MIYSYQDLTIDLEHQKISGETTVKNAITEVAAMMGENVRLRRGFVIDASSNGIVSTYLHTSPQPGFYINYLIQLKLKLCYALR